MNWKLLMILWQVVRPALKAAWPEFQKAIADGAVSKQELGKIAMAALKGLYGSEEEKPNGSEVEKPQ